VFTKKERTGKFRSIIKTGRATKRENKNEDSEPKVKQKKWERDFLQQQSQGVDIEFGNFLEIYYKDMDVRLREHTMYTKRYIIRLEDQTVFWEKDS